MDPNEISARDAGNDASQPVVRMELKPMFEVHSDGSVQEVSAPQPAIQPLDLPTRMTTVHGPLAQT